MKTCLIHGTMRKGSTYHITKMILDKLDSDLNNEVTEFFLPKDMPNFCVGCYQCIFKGEQLCPHASSVNKIHQAMVDADLIIITSPVYVFDVSGQLKAMFDHFGYQWMSHRPNKTMFNKIGLSVVTAAGAGMKSTTKTMITNMSWWGMKRVYSLDQAVMAASYAEITPKIMAKIEQKTSAMAKRLSKALKLQQRLKPSLKTSFLFRLMKMMKKGHPEWNELDHQFWKDSGYFLSKMPWHDTLNSTDERS
jgi:multimeric flavodoxin WrbA